MNLCDILLMRPSDKEQSDFGGDLTLDWDPISIPPFPAFFVSAVSTDTFYLHSVGGTTSFSERY